eukprot:CAMPEP_0119563158 /NCGR_PEP_ID=MMETSP1352-20130426/22600_1 /TAXON_ID=265584 /ORGANISM="Stauroneis constricta, Strain CCMP1120" /LENGTH=352 /DNA_ID=CAMNT_0007611703 /DNA_START=195 /DNA_END=1253 /DNA_ORIENTATION=+
MRFSSALVISGATIPSAVLAFQATPSRSVVTLGARQRASAASNHKTTLFSTAISNDVIEQQQQQEEQQQMQQQPAQQKSYLDDGFVFGLEGSGLDRPKGKVAQLVVEGDDLETKPYQVAIVAGTFLAHAAFAVTSFSGMLAANNGNVLWTGVQALLLVLSSWALADFGSGVLHWSVDNYGNGRTPVMGKIIAAFQGHHSAPWTITERGFCNNVYKLCTPFGPVTMAAISLLTGPFATFFFTMFCVFEILSQEFHKWSHMTLSQTPKWANQLQNLGLTISRGPHAQHHIAPYDGNYCIISGVCNPVLDKTGFFRWVEHVVYKLNGVESNAWKLDPELKAKTLRGEYALEASSQ